MSRTYKDQPYYIRKARANKVRLTRQDYCDLTGRGYGDRAERYSKRWSADDEIFGDKNAWWNFYKWEMWQVPAWFTRSLNAEYRAKIKQEMREGNYDTLPINKRNADWLWW